MKKMLIFINNDVGLFKFRKELIQGLQYQGWDVYAGFPDGEMTGDIEGIGCKAISIPVDRRGVNPLTDMKLVRAYKKVLREIQPDYVLTYTIKPNIYGGYACARAKIPYAENITGLGTAFQKDGIMKKLVSFLYSHSCKHAEKVFFENRENLSVFLDNRIIRESQSYVLPGAGVNLTDYPFSELPDSSQGTRFLFIGRVMKEKGVDELFEAVAGLKEKKLPVELDVVGPFEEDYAGCVGELTQKGLIRFHGFQKDVRPFIENCHCLVLPSYHEGMANTLLEAASMGRPLITCDISGCREAVEDGWNGFLCRVKDAGDLAGKMEAFSRLDVESKARMGKESRSLMERIFDKQIVVEETLKQLQII